MQASVINEVLSNEYIADKLKKLVSQSREMNEASLDASMYKGDIRKYLENLPEDEFVKILGKLVKEEKEIQEEYNHQDLENSATGRSYHGIEKLGDRLRKEKVEQDDHSATACAGNDCPQDVENHDTSVVGQHDCNNNSKDLLTEDLEREVQVDHPDHPQAPTDAGNDFLKDPRCVAGRSNMKDNSSKLQLKQPSNRKPQELSPQERSPASACQKYKNYQQLSTLDDYHKKVQIPHNQSYDADSSSSSSENLSESDEELTEISNTDSEPGTPSPTQVFADDNRNILHAREYPYSEAYNSHQSSCRQDEQDQLPEISNPQIQTSELLVIFNRLSKTLYNNSKVAVLQANSQSRNIQGTSCSNCDSLQEENNYLKEQKMNLEQDCQQLQDQIDANEESLRNLEYEIRSLRQWRDQLLYQIAACEETNQAQNEDRKGDKKIRECLVKKIKKLQDELNVTIKRAYEFAQKREDDFDALQVTIKYITKAIEEIQKKLIAEKEENKLLKKRLKEKGKVKELDEQGLSSRQQGNIGHVHQLRGLRALQQRLRLSFLANDTQENNLNHEQDNGDDVVD